MERTPNGKKKYQWTVLPQGFTESPNLFGKILEQVLETFKPLPQVELLQYEDNLFISRG
jgi:hypothetical protein